MINKNTAFDYAYIIVGSALTALSIALFTTPARIAPGGVSGVGTILYHTLGWDTGLVILVLSIPLFFLGWWLFGGQYGIKSLVGSVLLSLFTSLWCLIFGYDGILDYSKDMSTWLSCLYGGVIAGFGMGLVMKSGSNTGGTDIIAQIIARYSRFTLGTSLFIVDGVIILASAFVFGIESALYAIIMAYICTVVVNKVILSMGTNYAKTVYIVSDHLDLIGNYILDEMGRGGTLLDAKGLYTKESRPMLMTVIPNRNLSKLTRKVEAIDPHAFLVIQETYHVLGEGYTPIEKMVRDGNNDYSQN